jgi:hypothetical protein
MQISSSTAASAATASSPVVDQVKRQAAILADDSGASTREKIDAYVAIFKSMAQSANSGSGWFQQSSQADRDAVNAVMSTASTARDIRQAADDFSARGMRADRNTNVMADQIKYLDSLPDDRQQMIFAGTASLDQTGSLNSWKAFLQQNADGRARQLADEAAARPAVKITLSDRAKAALGQSPKAEDPASAALATLTGPAAGRSIASTALQMLQDAADMRADARDKARDAAADPGRRYEAGDHLDASI